MKLINGREFYRPYKILYINNKDYSHGTNKLQTRKTFSHIIRHNNYYKKNNNCKNKNKNNNNIISFCYL